MLSVLIETRNNEAALARTLGSLVGAAVEGMVREVIVCDAGSTDRTHRVADQTGCHYLPGGGLAAGILQSKGDWLLLLEPGSRLGGDWIEAVAAHTASGVMPARFTPVGGGFLGLLQRGRPLAHGLLVTRSEALALAGRHPSAAAMARNLRPRRIGGEIHVAGR